MNKANFRSNFRWLAAALVLGAGAIYAVFSVDDSIAKTGSQAVAAAAEQSGLSSAAVHAAPPALSARAQEPAHLSLNPNLFVNPFGK